MSNFHDEKLTPKNLDNFYIRRSIFQAIKENLPKLEGALLDVGCGQMPYKSYILEHSRVKTYTGIDIEGALVYNEAVKPDDTWDGKTMPYKDDSYDSILLTEVLEHSYDPRTTLKECHRVLKKGGHIVFSTPFLWPLHETPHDEYRYTPYALEKLFKDAGFKQAEIIPGGGWHASLGQMLGLWARRSGLAKTSSWILSYLLLPVMRALFKKDAKAEKVIQSQQMHTNYYGAATK